MRIGSRLETMVSFRAAAVDGGKGGVQRRPRQWQQPTKVKAVAADRGDGFDMAKNFKQNNAFYDVWDRNEDFFGQVVEYYEDRTEVKCYEEGGKCSSDTD